MKYIRFYVIVMSLFCLACQQNKDSFEKSEKTKLVLKQVTDTMFFNDGASRYTSWYQAETNQLVYSNKTDSVYEYYDLATLELVRKVKVDSKYWEFASTAADELMMFSENTITFMYDTAYNLKGPIVIWDIDKEGVREQIDIDFSYEPDMIAMQFNQQFPPFIDRINGKIYGSGIDFSNFDQKKYPLDTEVMFEYDIETGRKKMLPFKFPAIAEYLNLCGMQSTTYGCIRGDSIIIGYSMAPDMDVYQVSTGELSRFIVPHTHYDSLAGNTPEVSTNRDLCRQGMLTEFFFGPIKYNPHQDLIYRTYRDKMSLMKPDSTFNTERDKPFGIQVLDPRLNILGDFTVDNMVYPWEELYELYPTKNGLMYSRNPGSTGDTIIIHYLNFVYE